MLDKLLDKQEVQYPFAYSKEENRIVHISEVKKGLACNCQCICCKGIMQARRGNDRAHHFSHIGADCNEREKATETALHEIAKDILKCNKFLNVPAYSLSATEDTSYNPKDGRQKENYHCFDKDCFYYDEAKVEKTVDSVRPDIILQSKTKGQLYVEINVTHSVDINKREKLRKQGVSCIEIDVSQFSKDCEKFNREAYEDFLINETKGKIWITHSDRNIFLEKLKKRNAIYEEDYQQKVARKQEELEKANQAWQQKWGEESEKEEEDENEISDVGKKILEKLNSEQTKPVKATKGAVLVLAGAGSGKTRVLTSRIAYLIEEKRVPASAILAITFTNKAAKEMQERLERITDISGAWVCTIHSMCVRILRMYADAVGISANFSIYSETERNNIIKKSFQECDFDDERLLKSIKFHIANAKMLGFDPERYAEEYAGDRDIDEITKVYPRYQKHLRENNALDFDDLLNETRNLLRRNEEAREYLGGRFRYILVDEFQDTNAVQYEIVKLLASVHRNLFAVGDDDQSIYGWRGAKIENILHFEKDFKNAKVFKLERNYRSTKRILKLANTVIKNNGQRKDKTLWTENDEGEEAKVHEAEEESGEARYIAHTIAGLLRQGYRYSDFAILMRLNALTRSFEQEFTADGIPFKVFGGFKFFERKEIKDLLAYLRLINNPFDSEAAVRIINFPKRGIGAKTVEALQNYAFETELSVYDALLDLEEMGFTSGTKQKLTEFRNLVKSWIIESQEMPVNELVKKIVVDTHMREAYADDSDESINKRANIEEFIQSVDEYCKLNIGATLTDYLNQVTLASDTDEMDDGNYVTLATVHSVKGLEFPCVFVCGMEENIMPVSRAVGNDDDMEEERRLMYVAITRAKDRLWFTRSKSRYLYGKREPTARSRFLKELSSELELPREARRLPMGYGDYDDPDMYGNSAYGGGRYASNDEYGGRRNSFGGSYGGSYGSANDRGNSEVTRTRWNGGSSYGGTTYGSTTYGSTQSLSSRTASSVSSKSGGFTYGSINKTPMKPSVGGKDLSAFKTGVRVKHPKFGIGVIVNARGVGSNMILDIAFEGLGIKQLSANLAPLTIL